MSQKMADLERAWQSLRESVSGCFECCTGLYWTMLVKLWPQITNLAMLSGCFKKCPD